MYTKTSTTAVLLQYKMNSERLQIRVTAEEKQMLRELVETREQTMCVIIRKLIREEWKKNSLKELRKK